MISKNKIKLIHSLKLRKYRDKYRLFVAEGGKVVGDLLQSFRCEEIYCTQDWWETNRHLQKAEIITQRELEQISFLKSPQQVLAVFRYDDSPTAEELVGLPQKELCLALDDVQDPGNVGTIVRLADWFGIKNIFASFATADVLSPKCVQATMGSLARVRVTYTDIPAFLSEAGKSCPVYGTTLDGEDIYKTELQSNGVIVLGNEGQGIGAALPCLSHRLYIPSFPAHTETAESLNVAIAAAVVCAEFRRRLI